MKLLLYYIKEKLLEMSIRYEIMPGFEKLQPFVKVLPRCFENEGKTIYVGRNVVKVMDIQGYKLNVKRYLIPSFFDRVVRSYLRRTKCWQAFTYAQLLLEKGIETPQPIAYVEERKNGLVAYSYFVSIHSEYPRMFYEFGDCAIEDCKDVIKAFAHYTARLHEAGFLHHDYSPGNILFDYIDGSYRFSLVDLNRLEFGKVSMKRGCANFKKLWGKKDFFLLLAKEYARIRGFDEQKCIDLILAKRKKFWTRYCKKRTPDFNLEL